MNSLEEIRARVERKRAQEEKATLLRELRGQDEPIDPDVVYLSVSEAAKEIGVCRKSVLISIREGSLKARKTKARGNKLAIHPKHLEEFKSLYTPRMTQK